MNGTAEKELQPLPNGWRRKRLGDICEIVMGQSPPGFSYNESGIGAPFHQGKIEFGDTFIGHATKWTTEPRRFASKGDIVMSIRAPVGPVNLTTERISIGRGLAAIKPSSNHLFTFYAFYLLRLLEPKITGNAGSVFASINKSDIQSIPIPLPPLAEQERIVRILDEKLAVIDKAKQAAETQLEATNALPGAYLREVIPIAESGMLPEGWIRVRLRDVCEPISTINPKIEPDRAFSYVDISAINRESKSIIEPKRILGKDAPSRARRKIQWNDVLVSTTRPNLNAVALVPKQLDDQVCSTGFCVLRPNRSLNPHYLFSFTKTSSFISSLSMNVNGAMYPAVTDSQVMDVLIPLPPLAEQERIVRILNEKLTAVEKVKEASNTRLDTINAMSAAYLRRAFAGEL